MKKILLILALLLAACDGNEGYWVGPHPATDPPPRIGVVGDSLIDCCDEAWVAGPMVQAHPTAIWSVGGTYLGSATTWMANLKPRPNIFVIAQGTNNARNGWDTTDEEQLGEYLNALWDVPCIVLVNMGYSNAAADAYKAGATNGNAYYQAVAQSSGGRIKLANWRGWSSYAPQWFDTEGIHHTPEGQQKYMGIITASVNQHINSGLC